MVKTVLAVRFAEVVRERAAKLGITQAELARRLGVSAGTGNRLWNGQAEVAWPVFMATCEILKLDARQVYRELVAVEVRQRRL